MQNHASESYDVLIVGAGTAGCAAAITAAQRGLRVGLIDRKAREAIGEKICGDLTPYEVVSWTAQTLGVEHPAGDEAERIIEDILLVAPNQRETLRLRGRYVMLNRHRFGQGLLRDALRVGTTLHDRTVVLAPLEERGRVAGVLTRRGDEVGRLEAPLTIDASGAMAALRPKVSGAAIRLERQMDRRDFGVAYREVRRLREPWPHREAWIYLSPARYGGGYAWVFPSAGSLVNVGVLLHASPRLPAVKQVLAATFQHDPCFRDSVVVAAGAAPVPLRRPLASAVASGFLCAGDAACDVNPLTGGGIDRSLISGALAGRIASEAVQADDVTEAFLWRYNLALAKAPSSVRSHTNGGGVRHPSAALISGVAERLTDAELDCCFRAAFPKHPVGGFDDLTRAITWAQRLQALVRLGRGSAWWELARGVWAFRQLEARYRQFPDRPEGLARWRRRLIHLERRCALREPARASGCAGSTVGTASSEERRGGGASLPV